jgi:uncharacterized protein DUF3224
MGVERARIGLAAVCFWAGLSTVAAQEPPAGRKGSAMTSTAKGEFDVKLTPIPEAGQGSMASARLTFDKTFRGDLEGSSQGEMWTADTAAKGSAGYVAIEKVSGTLRGRSGAFTLLHRATMRQGGDYDMNIVVVPDSGTGALAGLSGKMTIILAEGKHAYAFDYALPDTP